MKGNGKVRFGIRPYAWGLPKVIPPTPDVAALGKFGEYPVANNYGTVPVSIPLLLCPTATFARDQVCTVNLRVCPFTFGKDDNYGPIIQEPPESGQQQLQKKETLNTFETH